MFSSTVLSILAALILSGTLIEIYQKVRPFPVAVLDNEVDEDSTLVKILKCFSIDNNGRKVLSSKGGGGDHLGCLSGIRTISMMWVVLGHSYLGGNFNQPVISNRSFIIRVCFTFEFHARALIV